MEEEILDIAVAYILLCKLNYSDTFSLISSKQKLFSREILHWLWEKYELSCDSKISKSWKKIVKIGLGSFKVFSMPSHAKGGQYDLSEKYFPRLNDFAYLYM